MQNLRKTRTRFSAIFAIDLTLFVINDQRMTDFASLDPFDRAILDLVQRNNQLTHAAIGDKVGLSPSAVRRRLSELRHKGVIARDVSLLAPGQGGVTLITTISFGEETVEAYDAFDQQIKDTPEILQGYAVAGSDDYVLIISGPSLSWYEDWAKSTFMRNPAIRRYDTRVVWSCKKFETALPLGD
jgi:Lrp/AsnC family leucine-responsive transcriptional regulator